MAESWGPWVNAHEGIPNIGDYIQLHSRHIKTLHEIFEEGFVLAINGWGIELSGSEENPYYGYLAWRRRISGTEFESTITREKRTPQHA